MLRNLMLACGLAASFVGSAAAEIIVYDNTAGELVWNPIVLGLDPPSDGIYTLDITQGPGQAQAETPHALVLWLSPNDGWPYFQGTSIRTGAGANITSDDPIGLSFEDEVFTFEFASQLPAGVVIGGGTDFDNRGYVFVDGAEESHNLSGVGFIGVEIVISGNTHYGWVELEATPTYTVKPLRWAWETTPGVRS